MHCSACEMLTESELSDLPHIKSVKASLSERIVTISGDFSDKTPEIITEELNGVLKKHGYSLFSEKPEGNAKWSDFKIAVPIALGFLLVFVALQKLGIVNLLTGGTTGYGTAFLVGIIASLSTCMAIVGGLVLSMSANFAKEGDKVKPQVLFHIGRLISFFILGGAIGALGSAFQLGGMGTFILSLLVGAVMLVLGINLLDIFHWTKKLQPTLPKFLSSRMLQVKKVNQTLTPFLLGAITFFLPCGFTQSMQLYALSTGHFTSGALTMLVFALGTLPVLSLLSFTSLGLKDKTKSGVFFKTAGIIVIFFALFNILNGMVAFGLIQPIYNL